MIDRGILGEGSAGTLIQIEIETVRTLNGESATKKLRGMLRQQSPWEILSTLSDLCEERAEEIRGLARDFRTQNFQTEAWIKAREWSTAGRTIRRVCGARISYDDQAGGTERKS